jgi:4-nitrophenyl phosphatase
MVQNHISSLLLDMDGVLWRGTQAIGDLGNLFTRINELGLRFILVTNNSTLTPEQYQQKLHGFGVNITRDHILTSSQVASHYLANQYPAGGPVYIIGENGLVEALREKGFFHSSQGALSVIVGMDRNINYDKLARACLLIRAGVQFLGTNADRSFPTPEGLVPGAGSILAALEAATDVKPVVLGKPSPAIFQAALKRLGADPSETLAVGDRLETDILGAQNVGCQTACVLSGVTGIEQAMNWKPSPNMIAKDLEEVIASFESK